MTDSVRPSALFVVASMPARLIGRFRPDLAASIRADGAVFRGARSGLLLLLVAVALGYPILTSFIHATITPQPEDTLFNWAITPWYTFTYSESIPFMIAVAGLGAFSPALGALLVVVLAPLDVAAAALAYGTGVELEPLIPSVAGRLLSYLLLWIVAVEVPLRARAWAARRPSASPAAKAAMFAVALGVGTFFWASSIGWLIVPVITWNTLGSEGAYVPLRMTEPSLAYSWVIGLGAALLAVPAGMVWAGRAASKDERPARSGRQGLLGELLRLALAAVLLSGLMKSLAEAAVLVTGLVVAGPILSRVLPRVQAPGFLAAIPAPVRIGVAILFAGSIAFVLVSGLPVGAVPDYLLLATLLATSMPVARIIVELGAGASRPTGPRDDAVAATSASLLIRTIGAAGLAAAWLALPALVFAEDVGEQQFLWVYPLAAAGLTAAAAAGVLWLNHEASDSSAGDAADAGGSRPGSRSDDGGGGTASAPSSAASSSQPSSSPPSRAGDDGGGSASAPTSTAASSAGSGDSGQATQAVPASTTSAGFPLPPPPPLPPAPPVPPLPGATHSADSTHSASGVSTHSATAASADAPPPPPPPDPRLGGDGSGASTPAPSSSPTPPPGRAYPADSTDSADAPAPADAAPVVLGGPTGPAITEGPLPGPDPSGSPSTDELPPPPDDATIDPAETATALLADDGLVFAQGMLSEPGPADTASTDELPPTSDGGTIDTGEAATPPQTDASSLPKQHDDPALEDLLPDEVGGEPITTSSYSGEAVVSGAAGGQKDPLGLAASGSADVTVAVGGNSSVTIGAYKVDGTTGQQLLDAATGQTTGSAGTSISQTTIGGKTVTAVTNKETGETVYLYADGDVLYAVSGPAPTDATLTETFQKLPPAST